MSILKFYQFLLEREALRDELPKHHINALEYIYGEDSKKFLDMDVPSKTENIKEGKWVLSKEEKDAIIGLIFDDIDIKNVFRVFKSCLSQMNTQFINAFNASKTDNSISFVLPKNAIDVAVMLDKFYSNNFYTINVKETKSSEIVFNKNKSSFNTFIDVYDEIFTSANIPNPLDDYTVNNFYSVSKEILDMDMFKNFDMELYITSKPSDILNMSISRFYDSCQNLYNGEYNSRLLSNVFDNNMKVAYLIFNTPFTDKEGNINPITSVSRCIIRNIKGKIFFDQIYPYLDNNWTKLQKMFYGIITKYTGMKSNYSGIDYYFNIPDELDYPYLDSLNSVKNPNNEEVKALLSLYKFDIEDIEECGDGVYRANTKNDRLFYITKNTDNFVEKCINGDFYFKKPLSKKIIKSIESNILNYFDFKKFGKDDGIKGNETVIKRKVNEIIKDYYENSVIDFIRENQDCLIVKKMIGDNHPYFLTFYTKDRKYHIVGDYKIYELV